MTRKELFYKLYERLSEVYENPRCSLDYMTPFELLTATILSAQCTDIRVNIVTEKMFKKWNTPDDFAKLSEKELSKEIKSTGFYKNKSKNIISCAKKIISDFNGQVPDNMEDLTSLDGVGRKTASVILGEVFKKPAIVIDTHAKRLSNRMGLTKETDPVKIEFDLAKFIPKKYQFEFCHMLVHHGRAYCKAQNPNCSGCPLGDLCPRVGVVGN